MYYHSETFESFSLWKEFFKSAKTGISNKGITCKIREVFFFFYQRKFRSSFSKDFAKELNVFVKLIIAFSVILVLLLNQFRKVFFEGNELLLKVERQRFEILHFLKALVQGEPTLYLWPAHWSLLTQFSRWKKISYHIKFKPIFCKEDISWRLWIIMPADTSFIFPHLNTISLRKS